MIYRFEYFSVSTQIFIMSAYWGSYNFIDILYRLVKSLKHIFQFLNFNFVSLIVDFMNILDLVLKWSFFPHFPSLGKHLPMGIWLFLNPLFQKPFRWMRQWLKLFPVHHKSGMYKLCLMHGSRFQCNIVWLKEKCYSWDILTDISKSWAAVLSKMGTSFLPLAWISMVKSVFRSKCQ